MSFAAQRELAEHEHRERIIAQGADPSLCAEYDQDGDTFSIYSDLSRQTEGRVNSTCSKIFYSSASTISTLRPDDEADNYQDELTDADLEEYDTMEQIQNPKGDTLLTAHDGSDDPISRKFIYPSYQTKNNF